MHKQHDHKQYFCREVIKPGMEWNDKEKKLILKLAHPDWFHSVLGFIASRSM